MSDITVWANNDVVQIAWRSDKPIETCLGFAIDRAEVLPTGGDRDWEALPAWVGFTGETNPAWQMKDTWIWPIQKFSWKDLTATRGKTYRYRVTPVGGEIVDGQRLAAIASIAPLESQPVTLTEKHGHCSAYFNRGILSTQYLAHQIPAGPSGAPNYVTLKGRIDQPGDPLRENLAGQLIDGLLSLLRRAETEGGTCYAALYELNDVELEGALLQASRLSIILSNTGPDDQENHPARQALHEKAASNPNLQIFDRFVPGGHIGHNKFIIYADGQGEPQAVLLGSTNWTDMAVCAQSNNALVVEDATLAKAYKDYWDRLLADTQNDDAKQGNDLRSSDAEAGATDIALDQATATVWFSPNTPHARPSHLSADAPPPPDLSVVYQLMQQAKTAVVFLAFQPGSPSIVDELARLGNARPDLFIRGAVTDPNAAQTFNTTLIHRSGEQPVNVVPASAIDDQFGYWQRELLKAGPSAHAIIHDKIVVIDPGQPGSVVITGSHNLGYRASMNNDENMLLVSGHDELSKAYAVHVLDVYDHYRFRYMIQKGGTHAFSGLSRDASWQDKYFAPDSSARRDLDVWFQNGAAKD
ncbi:phospholipase D-like domain-containing protein [Rhizobium sp. BR 314]|uniref:phospholipase D-like domain-containing protein n=1 Tax=Rhizobium sp. BR 314 TaxID=3040013 RepID=UPI0039BFBE2E